jgi:hypothetical protein
MQSGRPQQAARITLTYTYIFMCQGCYSLRVPGTPSSPTTTATREAPTSTCASARGPTLAVQPRALRNGQTQRYAGRLLGPYSPGGFVDVEVQDGKRRKLVCSVSTRGKGRYACDHRFRRTIRRTRYVFRARVRRQTGMPYESGASAPRPASSVPSSPLGPTER